MIQTVAMAPRYMSPGGMMNFIWNPGDSLICRARNNIVHDFLMNPCVGQPEYLFFADTDISFVPDNVFRLLNHRIRGIVCGQYALKSDKHQWCYNTVKGEETGRDGLLKVKDAGTGFMVIHRDVFKTMSEKLPTNLWYNCDMNKDRRFSFFNAGVANGRYLSEDWVFCHRAGQLGFPVLIDTKVTVKHHGWAAYPRDVIPESPKKKGKNGLRRSASK